MSKRAKNTILEVLLPSELQFFHVERPRPWLSFKRDGHSNSFTWPAFIYACRQCKSLECKSLGRTHTEFQECSVGDEMLVDKLFSFWFYQRYLYINCIHECLNKDISAIYLNWYFMQKTWLIKQIYGGIITRPSSLSLRSCICIRLASLWLCFLLHSRLFVCWRSCLASDAGNSSGTMNPLGKFSLVRLLDFTGLSLGW